MKTREENKWLKLVVKIPTGQDVTVRVSCRGELHATAGAEVEEDYVLKMFIDHVRVAYK